MKKNVQRIMATILTVIMMVSMLPFNVFASDLDTDMFVEPAVEAVSVPGEEREIESTVEDVLVGNAETEDELLVEDAEIVEDSSEEIETVDAADPAEADVVEESEEFAATETVGAGADGTGFPASFTYGNDTYEKYGDPVGLNANFRVTGVNLSTWEFLNERVISTGKIYYQEYRFGSSRIVVWELPTTVQISQGSGYYINPDAQRWGGRINIGKYNGAWSNPPFSDDAYFGKSKQYKIVRKGAVTESTDGPFKYLAQGETTYSFDGTAETNISERDPVDVMYRLYSGTQGSEPIISHTYKITYKDGVDDVEIFRDQVYEDEYAIEGHATPHFKWPDKETGSDGDPVRPGYRFMGWTDQDGNSYANSDKVAAVKITGNATYTAQWAPNSITVSKEVVVGDGVEASEINHTIYIALWDGSGYLKKANGKINYKEITVTNGVASGPVVFDENDLLESKDYTVWELAEVEGDDPSALREIEVNGKTIHVTVQAYELNEAGEIIKDGNNTHLDTTNTAYIKLNNKYTSDFTSFTLYKQWYDVNGNDVTSSIKDVTATIKLYKTDSDGVTTEAGSIVLDGTADGNGESSAWKAEFTNLNSAYTYKAKETSCSLGYHAYQANDYAQPMGDNDYKVFSGQTICNLPDRYGIYHSSNGTTEWFAVGENIKLVDEVEPGYLYGGYYKYTETGNHKGSALDTYAKTGLDEDFTATENNTIYYLKEVDDKYLVPLVFITYNTRKEYDPQYLLRGLWVLMNLDPDYSDYNNKFGFIIDGGEIQPDFTCEELEVNHKDTGSTHHTLNSLYTDTFEEGARLVVSDQASKLTKNNEFTLRAYFVTPDGVRVTGIKERIIHTGNLTFANKSWNEDGGGIWQYTPKPYPGSETVLATSKLGASTTIPGGSTYQIKSAADILTYTVTKIDDGKKVSQEVQVGDNVGKITYAGKKGYAFAGWYLDKAYTKVADFSAVTGDMTVYAKYVKASAIDLSFAKKSSKSGSVTLKATLKVTGAPDLTDAAVSCDYKGQSSAVKFTGVKTTMSGKTTVSTYTGTVDISGLANKGSFTASISYKTPDGTIASLADKTCKYTSGKVTVK